MKPSIEKRFLNNYSESAIKGKVKEMKIVDYMKENNLSFLDEIAVSYFKNEITYKEFFDLIDKAFKTYKVMGIEKGDYVPVSSPNFIEGLASFYALNMIGAIPNMISPLASSEEFEHHLKEAPVKNVIIFDQNLKNYTEILKKAGIENTVLVSANTYLPKNLKIMKKFVDGVKGDSKSIKIAKSLAEDSNPIYFDEALLKYADEFLGKVETADYNFDDTALLLHTGGTTGFPKAVEVTDNNYNGMINQYETTIDNIKRGDTIVTVLPMNIGFGLCNNMGMPLRMGVKLVLHPKFNPKEVYDLFKKHKPNHFMATSTFFKCMMDDPRFDGEDLSYIKTLCYGGEGWSEENREKFNEWLEKHNAKNVKIANGYGANEGVSSFEYEQDLANGERGLIPLVNNNRKIVKVDISEDGKILRTDEELDRGEIGEVCETGLTLTKGYKDNEEETNEVFRKHSDGTRWLHTGDLGYIDENDCLHLNGRIKRIHLTIGEDNAPAKFFPDSIESCILKSKYVKEACVVGIPDDEKTNVPVAFVTLEDDYCDQNDVINDIDNLCQALSVYSRPVNIYIKEELPKTKIGKNDFNSLTTEAINIKNKSLIKQKTRVK
ncbi:MAG: class I adenylate-forming enzyme family protein [Bacilli bacterium]